MRQIEITAPVVLAALSALAVFAGCSAGGGGQGTGGAAAAGTGGIMSGGGGGGRSGSGGASATGGAASGGAATGGATTGGASASTGGRAGTGVGGHAAAGGAAGATMSGGIGGGLGARGGGGSAGSGTAGMGAAGAGPAGLGGSGGGDVTAHLDELKRTFLAMQFGIWHHFGILTYTGSWAQANLPINDFNPGTTLNPQQWAQAAKAAGAKFGVLTTRHHDGFALWPSKASNFNVGHTTWYAQHGGQPAPNDKGDVVQQFVNGYRAEGLTPVFYYSIWDSTYPVSGPLTTEMVQYLTTQLTELLTNYGPIPFMIIDGWGWQMGHHAAEFSYLHNLIKSLQPDILIVDHQGLESPFEGDFVMYEEPKGTFAPADNTWAAVQGQKVNQSGGNDWFWSSNIGNYLSVSNIVDTHVNTLVGRHTNFILNCPPNNQGLLSDAIVSLLGQVGTYRQAHPAPTPTPLPTQGPTNTNPYYVLAATASTGDAGSAIDGKNDFGSYSVWQSTGGTPQWVQMDLGAIKPAAFVGYLPPYTGTAPAKTGIITGYQIDTSTNGTTFTTAASGTWPADGRLKAATFGPVQARYVRLIATSVNSGNAAATEVDVGGPQAATFTTPKLTDWGH